MTDLVAFLNARLDEDEAVAHIALRMQEDGAVIALANSTHGPWRALSEYDPARALREVEAKRAILESYASTLALVEHPPVMQEGHPYAGKISAQDYLDARRELAVLRPAIAVVAAIYSDHPDYQPEWAVA